MFLTPQGSSFFLVSPILGCHYFLKVHSDLPFYIRISFFFNFRKRSFLGIPMVRSIFMKKFPYPEPPPAYRQIFFFRKNLNSPFMTDWKTVTFLHFPKTHCCSDQEYSKTHFLKTESTVGEGFVLRMELHVVELMKKIYFRNQNINRMFLGNLFCRWIEISILEMIKMRRPVGEIWITNCERVSKDHSFFERFPS